MQVSGKYVESVATLCIFFAFATVLTQLLHRKNASPSTRCAALAQMATVAGALVIYCRDIFPAQLVFALSNSLFEACIFSCLLGVIYYHRLEKTLRPLMQAVAAGLVLCGGLMASIPLLTAQYRYRMLMTMPFFCLAYGLIAWVIARRRTPYRPISQSISFYLAITGLLCSLLRLIDAGTITDMFPPPSHVNFQSMLMNILALTMFGTALTLVFWQIEAQNQRLRQLAEHDGLTGLQNRRSFMEQCRQRLQQSRPVALLIFDIDHFKQINDRFGHMYGDKVLRELGEHLRTFARRDDLLARYGGEEFCLFSHDATLDQLASLAERLRASVAGLRFGEGPDCVMRITISIGGVAHPGPDTALTLESLLQTADARLYMAKRSGRNQAIVGDALIEAVAETNQRLPVSANHPSS